MISLSKPRTALQYTQLARATRTTIRNKLIRIGAVIPRSIRFHLSTSYPQEEHFARASARLQYFIKSAVLDTEK